MKQFIVICLAVFNLIASETAFFLIPLEYFKFEILFTLLTIISIVNLYNYLNTGE